METFILILMGATIGLSVSKSTYHKGWDVFIGALGALAIGLMKNPLSANYSPYFLLIVALGEVAIIYFGRLLQNSSLN